MQILDSLEDARAAEIAAWAEKRDHALRGSSMRPDGSFDMAYIEESQRLTEAAMSATRALVSLFVTIATASATTGPVAGSDAP